MKYRNALWLYPYYRETSAAMGFFPPTGLEYIATALEGYVDEIALIDLRQEREYHTIDDLRDLIKQKIDLMCVSVNWSYYFEDVCHLINCLPDDVRLEIYKSPAMLRKAEKAGLKILLMGIESPHDKILKQLDKGFTSKEIREAFDVLRNYAFYYHCYFIYGNIGESEEEMLYIPQFAKEIGADSISYMRLQVRKFSPLKETIEKTPGYHISPNGFVYSDRYGSDDLRRIRKDIKRTFYTPYQLYKIIRKLWRIRCITLVDLFVLIPRFPMLLYRLTAREFEKKRRKRRKAYNKK